MCVCVTQEYDKYNPLHEQFWKALAEVAEYELQEAKKRDEVGHVCVCVCVRARVR